MIMILRECENENSHSSKFEMLALERLDGGECLSILGW